MFPLGHLGITLALVVGAQRVLGPFRIDYRLVLVAALLPDFIDKPLSAVLGIGGRAIAHTLLFALALTALFLVLRTRTAARGGGSASVAAFLALAIGTWTHLLLDRMWDLPEVLFWPFLGVAFPLETFDLFFFLGGFQDPYVVAGEVVGALLLGYLAWRTRVYRRVNLVRFLRTGRLSGNAEGSVA